MMAIVIWGHLYLSSYVLEFFCPIIYLSYLKTEIPYIHDLSRIILPYKFYLDILFANSTYDEFRWSFLFSVKEEWNTPKPLNMGLWFFIHWMHATDWWSVDLFSVSILNLHQFKCSSQFHRNYSRYCSILQHFPSDNKTWEDYLKFTKL